jgi:hypothetical protein
MPDQELADQNARDKYDSRGTDDSQRREPPGHFCGFKGIDRGFPDFDAGIGDIMQAETRVFLKAPAQDGLHASWCFDWE